MSPSGAVDVRAHPGAAAPHAWLALAGALPLGECALLAACFDAIPRVTDSHRWWAQILTP